jgi:hypothetical protein
MGGVYNTINLQCYHYTGNNPVKYVYPNGRDIKLGRGEGVTDEQWNNTKAEAEILMSSGTDAGDRSVRYMTR